MSNIKQKIIQAKVDFINKNGKDPQKIFLTLEDENQLISLHTQDVGGNLSGKLFVNGAREVFKKGIFGIKKIIWEAKEFKL